MFMLLFTFVLFCGLFPCLEHPSLLYNPFSFLRLFRIQLPHPSQFSLLSPLWVHAPHSTYNGCLTLHCLLYSPWQMLSHYLYIPSDRDKFLHLISPWGFGKDLVIQIQSSLEYLNHGLNWTPRLSVITSKVLLVYMFLNHFSFFFIFFFAFYICIFVVMIFFLVY